MQSDAHCHVVRDGHLWRITYMTRTRTGDRYAALSLVTPAPRKKRPLEESDWVFDEWQARLYAESRRQA